MTLPIRQTGLEAGMLAAMNRMLAMFAVCIAILLAAALMLVWNNRLDAGVTLRNRAIVEVQPTIFLYRPAGDFLRDGKPTNPPTRTITIERPLAIMRHQVSAAEYQRCVDEGACTQLAPGVAVDDRPAVQVSWRDAEAYGTWLSRKTGIHYRLPSDQEWAIAAGTLFRDDALPDGDDGNPAQRWLAKYESEASSNVPESDQASLPITSFAVNENGLFNVAGDVWEWTNTCFVRQALDGKGGSIGEPIVNCGVRVVEGRHRTYISDFIRDARAGGCAIGTPPTSLGFRLVREDDGSSQGARLFAKLIRNLSSLRLARRPFLDSD
jgi:formylglycine-generating enzyme required for sulfatase activity